VLHEIETHVLVDGTRVTAHCHCLKLDGNGRPRVEPLVNAVIDHVIDYAVPRSVIREAREELERTGSTRKFARLQNEAKELFTDLEQSGEGGELLLFVLAEVVLRLPQLICKMSLKTNQRMHIHGADGLHAGVDPISGRLILYWGESKIHGDVTSAVRECLASVAPMLSEYNASKRDLQLLQRHADLDDEPLELALKKFLAPDSNQPESVEFQSICLVGFDSEAYPKGPSRIEVEEVAKQIVTALPTWKGHVKKRITDERLDAFGMHFLFVPFPSVDEFRGLIKKYLGIESPPTTRKGEGRPPSALKSSLPQPSGSSAKRRTRGTS
jgi:hypothetical protein